MVKTLEEIQREFMFGNVVPETTGFETQLPFMGDPLIKPPVQQNSGAFDSLSVDSINLDLTDMDKLLADLDKSLAGDHKSSSPAGMGHIESALHYDSASPENSMALYQNQTDKKTPVKKDDAESFTNDIEFDIRFRGYDRKQVDHYIDQFTEEYNAICKQKAGLEKENEELRKLLTAVHEKAG